MPLSLVLQDFLQQAQMTKLKTCQLKLSVSSWEFLKNLGLGDSTLTKLFPNQTANWLVTGIRPHRVLSILHPPPFPLDFWVTRGFTLLLFLLGEHCSRTTSA